MTLSIEMMETFFHCCGTVEVESERLNSRAIGLQKTGAPSLRNHAGSPSSPVAVCLSLSRIWKTLYSEMYSVSR